jgi:hypothetical protein
MTPTPASSSPWRNGPSVGPEQTRVETWHLSSGTRLKMKASEVPLPTFDWFRLARLSFLATLET